MVLFSCLPCIFCCFYCYFRCLNLYSWGIIWYPTTRNLWSVNQFSLSILFCCFCCYFFLTQSLLKRYHLISYHRKPLIYQSKTYKTEMDNCTWLYSYTWHVNFLLFTLSILLFLFLFSLTESLLMRYHLKSYDRKPLICQSKTYQTEMDNCTSLYSYRWYVNFFAVYIVCFAFFIAIFAH